MAQPLVPAFEHRNQQSFESAHVVIQVNEQTLEGRYASGIGLQLGFQEFEQSPGGLPVQMLNVLRRPRNGAHS